MAVSPSTLKVRACTRAKSSAVFSIPLEADSVVASADWLLRWGGSLLSADPRAREDLPPSLLVPGLSGLELKGRLVACGALVKTCVDARWAVKRLALS